MAIGNVILLICLALSVGSLFGLTLLPNIIDLVVLKFKFNARRASYTSKSVERQQLKKIEESAAYIERLSQILKLIKQTSEAGECQLKVAWFFECETDMQIKKELGKRNFDCWYSEENTLRISW